MTGESYREILRQGLRQAAKHPKKIDRLSDAQVEELTIRMAEAVNAALVKFRTLTDDMGRVAGEIRRTLRIPELE